MKFRRTPFGLIFALTLGTLASALLLFGTAVGLLHSPSLPVTEVIYLWIMALIWIALPTAGWILVGRRNLALLVVAVPIAVVTAVWLASMIFGP